MTPNQLKLAQAANEKRSKELDARETYLNEREKLLETAPIDIKVLESTIAVREKQLTAIQGKVEQANKAYDANIASNERSYEDMRFALTAEEDHVRATKRKMAEIKAQGQALVKENDQIEQEIAGRKAYLVSQEQLIAQTVEAGNEQITILKYQTEDMEDQKSQIVAAMAILNHQKNDLENGLLPLQTQTEELQRQYDETATRLRTTLEGLKHDIIKASADYKRITAETEDKLRQLKVHEEEIMAKWAALNVERRELDTEKRRWAGTQGLYKLQ